MVNCSVDRCTCCWRVQHVSDLCLPHLHSTPPLGVFQSEYCHAVWYGKTRLACLPYGKKNLKIQLLVLTESTNVTDTHTHADTHNAWRHRPRLCIASRGKNAPFPSDDKMIGVHSGMVSATRSSQLSQIGRAMLRVVEYFAESLKVAQDHSKWHSCIGRV